LRPSRLSMRASSPMPRLATCYSRQAFEESPCARNQVHSHINISSPTDFSIRCSSTRSPNELNIAHKTSFTYPSRRSEIHLSWSVDSIIQ
jgi:hypothetical protein